MAEYIFDTIDLGAGIVALRTHQRGEIVRCRDCRRWATEKRYTGGCIGMEGRPDPGGYCARGKRAE